MKTFYGPKWILRLHFQMSKNSTQWTKLCSLVCQEPNIDICDMEKNPKLGNATRIFPLNWRFLPAIDSQVDYLFVRDLDSEITQREAAATQEFLKLEQKDFHVLRDHPQHGIHILGGTWGVKLTKPTIRKSMVNAMKRMFKHPKFYAPRDKAGPDQDMLSRYIW